MARIYFEYTKNVLFEYPDYFMFALFIATAFMLVSIGDVFINITNISRDHSSSLFSFLFAALRDTSWIIQVLIAGFIIRVAISGIRMTYRNMHPGRILAKFKY